MRNNKDSTPYDAGYKLLFSNPRIVQDLLEGFVRPEWIDEIDFQTLEPFKASFATDDLRERHDDSIWRVKMGPDWRNRLLRVRFRDEAIPELHNLNEVDAMLSEKLDDWTEQWKKEGLEQGRKQEAATILTRFLTKRFGALDDETTRRIEAAPVEQIEAWSDRVLDAETLEEVFEPAGSLDV